jgi:hypothetical protein
MRRLVLLLPWALGLVLLLTHGAPADDPIEALLQAERQAKAKLADAYRQLEKAEVEAINIERSIMQPPPYPPRPTPEKLKIKKLEQEARQAESNAQQAAEARRAAEARGINTANAATKAREQSRERSEKVADRAKHAADPHDPFDALRKFDAEEARKDFKMALERETELLDNDADLLEAEANKSGASDEAKAAAKSARLAADGAAANLRREFPGPHPPLFPRKRAKPTTETGPSDSAPPPGDFLPSPFEEVIIQREVTDPPSFASVGPPGVGSQSVSIDMRVTVPNPQTALVCILPGDDVEKVAAALELADYEVVAQISTGTVIAAEGVPQAIEAKAKEKRIPLCFVEINFCVIKAPLTAFRGHEHRAHPGGIHNHDAPDPPWSWAVTPPEPVVSWGGQ